MQRVEKFKAQKILLLWLNIRLGFDPSSSKGGPAPKTADKRCGGVDIVIKSKKFQNLTKIFKNLVKI